MKGEIMKGKLVIHPDDIKLFAKVSNIAYKLAKDSGITTKFVFEPKRRPLEDGAMGLCYKGTSYRISVVVRYKNRADEGGKWYPRPRPLSAILSTVAHEVAHLVHFDHSPAFRELEEKLKHKVKEYA